MQTDRNRLNRGDLQVIMQALFGTVVQLPRDSELRRAYDKLIYQLDDLN